MRWFLSLLIVGLTACAPASKAPEVAAPPAEIGGVMLGETVLEGEYLLVTDLLIPEGSRLVIKAGTTVRVRRAELTKIDPEFLSSMTELLVRGELVIEGSPGKPVIIAPEKTGSPDDPAWAGLLLDNVRSSSIRHAQIRGAETGVLLITSEMILQDCQLEQNRYGLVVQGGRPLLERNRISEGEGGLFIWRGAAPVLNENVIVRNEEEGIAVDRSSHPQYRGNYSSQNAIGLVSSVRPDDKELQLLNNGESWRSLPVRNVTE